MTDGDRRRAFLIAGAGAVLAACRKDEPSGANGPAPGAAPSAADASAQAKEGQGDDVSATEDLMREHGVIRRVLVVYREVAARLLTKPASVAPDALQRAAKLMQTFAEDYHERQLEEANIFPALTGANPLLGSTVKTLIAQHQRGREITEYVLAAAQKTMGGPAAEPLARTLEAFARMYEEHAAVEDTIVFPAWKKALSPSQLDAMGDLFEDIEHKTFGRDGFADAVDQVSAIERTLGIDLASLTASPPPR